MTAINRLFRIVRVSFVVAAVSALLPAAALACAVCMTGKEDDTRIAFELMTAFMTVTPFLLGGGVLWWLRGRLKEIESMHERAREQEEAAERGSSPLSALDS